jgi:Tol biopolymer transport system component/DNA-binding winged helix-turn-helix (wHTH) protein
MDPDQGGRSYLFGPFRLDAAERLLLRDNRPVPLTPKVFDLLEILVSRHGHLVEKEALQTALWPDSFVEEGGLTRCVSVLRRVLGDADQAYIETVPKRGYRFTADVTDAAPASASPRARRPGVVSWRPATIVGGMVVVVSALAHFAVRTPDTTLRPSSGPIHRQLTFTGKEGTPTLSPEGSRIAYVSYQSPNRHVIVRERDGGPPLVVFSAPEAGSLRWSPDGTALLFWARGDGKDGLYFASTSGGTASRIAPNLAVAAWSPDGSTIAMARPLVGQISLRNRQGVQKSVISLTEARRWISDIDWSAATGLLLVVTNDPQGQYTIWTVRPDGTGQTRILADTAKISTARWDRSGRAVYYHRQVAQTSSVYKLALGDPAAAKTEPAALMTGLETDGAFGMSGDGRRLVYARAPYSSSLWMVDLPVTGEVRTRALTDGTWRTERPRFSPDGKRILFTVGHEDRANLYTVPVDGGAPAQLTFMDAFNGAGVWSDDGRSIAFVSTAGGGPQVWRIPADGGTPSRVSAAPVSDSFQLAWGPGKEVLVHQPGNRTFLALDPATRRTRPMFGDGSVGWIFSPVFSPDGGRVAVGWSRAPDFGLWLFDLGDGTARRVTKDAMLPIGWSSDGASIYVIDGKRSASRDLAVDGGETITDAVVRRVFLNGRIEPVVTLPFAEVGGIAISPDGRRLVCSVYATSSDVWLVEDFDVSDRR